MLSTCHRWEQEDFNNGIDQLMPFPKHIMGILVVAFLYMLHQPAS